MDIALSDIVVSLAGRDKGKLFLVAGTEKDFLLIADGKGRKLEKPKRKKRKHLRLMSKSDSPAAEKIRNGGKVINSEIRRALAEYSEAADGQNRGG